MFAQIDAAWTCSPRFKPLSMLIRAAAANLGAVVASKDGSRRHCLGNAGEDVEFALEYR
ncbi:MAG TPA: hypothetical protein VFK10_15470 [Burkholderiaceae bacterium]|nr:hypothetical protein [Burkholderiaceae bacterium]